MVVSRSTSLMRDCSFKNSGRAEQVQVIGSKFVLYKRNETDPKIELPKSQKRK